MQTVNFPCSHCGKLMAVSTEHLGQQVRCPNCQQVVLAPPNPENPPPPSPFPDLHVPSEEAPDSIFALPGQESDDALGGEQDLPKVEFPPEPAPLPVDPPTLTYNNAELSDPSAETTDGIKPLPPEGIPPPNREGMTVEPEPADLPSFKKPTPPVRRGSGGSPWFTLLVVVPLISYSILATIAIVVLMQREPPHPLEVIPDLQGDHKGGASRKDNKSGVLKMPPAEQDLPQKLHVHLGSTLAIGDLEVTPLSVDRRRVSYAMRDKELAKGRYDSLALTLRLHNRSTDVTFYPLDRFFQREYDGKGAIPYTYLEIGKNHFFGGPIKWLSRSDPNYEWIDQQKLDQVLNPGETLETFVCTNPDKDVTSVLDKYDGAILWRVQVRRGLVKWKPTDHDEREDSACAVVGVEFNSSDVQKLSQ
jgi:hypothetical protein